MKILSTTVETIIRYHIHVSPDQDVDEVCAKLKSRGFKIINVWHTTVKTTILAEIINSVEANSDVTLFD